MNPPNVTFSSPEVSFKFSHDHHENLLPKSKKKIPVILHAIGNLDDDEFWISASPLRSQSKENIIRRRFWKGQACDGLA